MPSALLARLLAERAQVTTDTNGLTERAETRIAAAVAAAGDGDQPDTRLTETEAAELRALQDRAAELDERIGELNAVEEREAAAAEVALRVAGRPSVEQSLAGGTPQGGAVVRSEPEVYGPHSRASWVLDAAMAAGMFAGRAGAVDGYQERQARYAQELETRDTTTAAYASLIPPQYLLDMFARILRAGRPFADAIMGMGLPGVGMSMIIPRMTAGMTVATQATQNTAPSTTDVAVTDLSVPVNTFQGRGVLSRQSVERGAINLDQLTFQDLAADAARYIDQQALYGTGAGGNALGAINTGSILTVTQTATTGLATIQAVANAIQQVNTARFVPPDLVVMHPRRWGALTVTLDSQNRPLVSIEAGQMNVLGQGEAAQIGYVGTILGVPVLVDPNLRTNLGAGTNQDEILVLYRGDAMLWEEAGGHRQFTFEQPVGPQSVQLAIYGNFAFTAARYPVGIAYISGVGLVPPTF